MTEPSIARARSFAHLPSPSGPSVWRRLPLQTNSYDAVFLFFAAHELRRAEARGQLFRELARILHEGGEIVLLEHPRDFWNFLAFGPGVFHFLPQRAWMQCANGSGFRITRDESLACFTHITVMRKEGGR